MRKTVAVLVAAPLVAGCQSWEPTWSEVTGARYYRTELNRMPTVIERIDGKSALLTLPVKVEPGRRLVELQGVPPTPGWRGTLQEYVLNAEPCKRYYLNAQFEGGLSVSQWTPVIDEVETIAGCVVAAAK